MYKFLSDKWQALYPENKYSEPKVISPRLDRVIENVTNERESEGENR